MNNIKAIIFDVDGTLINRKNAFLRFCDYMIEKYASDYPYLGTRNALIDYMIEIDGNGYGGIHNFIPKVKKLWELPHSIEEFIKERNEVFGKLTTPFEETYDVLDLLKTKYKLGVITNGYSNVQREKIESIGIAEYFDDIIVSGDQEFEKPDVRIFELSCKNLGVSSDEAVYVGDYYPNDIARALNAKNMPIWISENPDEHIEYSGIRVSRLKDVLKFL